MNRKKKIKYAVGIFLISLTMWQFGLFHRFNYITAYIDIWSGHPRIVDTGPPFVDVAIISLNEEYGFYMHHTHCTNWGPKFRGIDAYNSRIEKYLNKRNGEEWREEYEKKSSVLFEEYFINKATKNNANQFQNIQVDTSSLFGIWGIDVGGDAAFRITNKDFYVVDFFETSNYSLSRNRLIIHDSDYYQEGEIIEVTKDTLKIKWEIADDVRSYWRFKN